MSSSGEHDATVKTLTAEVRVLMVGSRQVTLSVYGQLDEIEYDEIVPFGRVCPKGDDDYICIVGKRKSDGVLARARVPNSIQAEERAMGFPAEYHKLEREVVEAERRAEFFEKHDDFYFGSGEEARKGTELAAEAAVLAQEGQQVLNDIDGKYNFLRQRLRLQRENAMGLPLIVLAGLR